MINVSSFSSYYASSSPESEQKSSGYSSNSYKAYSMSYFPDAFMIVSLWLFFVLAKDFDPSKLYIPFENSFVSSLSLKLVSSNLPGVLCLVLLIIDQSLAPNESSKDD